MKILPAVVAVPFLVLLLSWLSIRAIDPDAERFDLALDQTNRFARLESDLQRDVLSARAGVLRDYDPLVQETDALDDLIGRLHRFPSMNRATRSAIDSLAAQVATQEDLVERFKTDNALLQNSLAYLASFSSDLTGAFATSINPLAAAMLRLTLDTLSNREHA